jgi:predicted nuclease of predicted toxin-antitoxin system
MRVLLDVCVPKRLARELPKHEVQSATDLGWGDLDDNPLLDAMGTDFDALVTVDKNLPKQQRLDHRAFGVVVLRAKTNRLVAPWRALRPHDLQWRGSTSPAGSGMLLV